MKIVHFFIVLTATTPYLQSMDAPNAQANTQTIVQKLIPFVIPGYKQAQNTPLNPGELREWGQTPEDIIDVRMNIFELLLRLHTIPTNSTSLPYGLTRTEIEFIKQHSHEIQQALIQASLPK